MTVVVESATAGPRDWLKSLLSALLASNRVAENQELRAANDAGYDLSAARHSMVHSRHTHYDPLQAAIEDGLEGWARHAMASNGFGDLP